MFLMILLQFMFWMTCAVCCAAAVWFGERDEKIGMAIIAIGSVATALIAAFANFNYAAVTIWFLVVDLTVLAAFLKLSFDSRKFWPIWVGSLQLISVVIHLLDLMLPKILPEAYVLLQGFWVYPMFLAIMMGTHGSRVAMRRKQVDAGLKGLEL